MPEQIISGSGAQTPWVIESGTGHGLVSVSNTPQVNAFIVSGNNWTGTGSVFAVGGSININNPAVIGSFLDTPIGIIHGRLSVPSGTAGSLAASTTIRSITITALASNTVPVYIGSQGVTVKSGAELSPTAGITLDINDPNKIYVVTSEASQEVSYTGVS